MSRNLEKINSRTFLKIYVETIGNIKINRRTNVNMTKIHLRVGVTTIAHNKFGALFRPSFFCDFPDFFEAIF